MPQLAEALSERKNLQHRLSRLQSRLATGVTVYEADQPAEQPGALVHKARHILAERLTMDSDFSRLYTSGSSPSLTGPIARRCKLEQRRNTVHVRPNGGLTRSEMTWRSVADLYKQIEQQINPVSQSYRLLVKRNKQANWPSALIQN
jgi:hypothetical protein